MSIIGMNGERLKQTILISGISIGPNTMVASGSILNKDVPLNSVAPGMTARIIRSLETSTDTCLAATPDYDRKAYQRDKA